MKVRITFISIIVLAFAACRPPAPQPKALSVKHNYIILLDLSDRLIVQPDQTSRDKDIIRSIFNLFEQKVKKELYIKSRDEIKVVIAPQRGSGLRTDVYEEQLYVNMSRIKNYYRRQHEEARRDTFDNALDELYEKAVFSKVPTDYYGADIWKYFYEDLQTDYSTDTLTKNFLFILTDGYPIVGKDVSKLQPVKDSFKDLHIVLMEVAPRDKDLEFDRIMEMWKEWFDSMEIKDYTFIKRKAITKEIEQVKDIIGS
jgi:hypothetical protein